MRNTGRAKHGVEEPDNATGTSARRPKRQPGGYRYKITHPVEPFSLLEKKVTVRWDKVQKLDGTETNTPKWFEGTVQGYDPAHCKHSVDYDEWDGEVPLELRMGLDAAVEIAIADDPPRAPKDFLLNLQSLLSHEVQGLKRVLAEQLQPGRERDRAQTKLKQKQQQVAVVTEMLDELQAEEDAAVAAAAAAAERETARKRPLPKDCPVMKRVGPVLADKWAQQQHSGSVGQPGPAPAQQQRQEATQPEQPSQSAAAEDDTAMQLDGDQPQDATAQQPAQPAAQRSRHGRVSLREVLALSQAQSTLEKEHVEQHLQAAVIGAGRVTRHTHEPHAAELQQSAQGQHAPAAAAHLEAAPTQAAPAEADPVPVGDVVPSSHCDTQQQQQQDMPPSGMQQQDMPPSDMQQQDTQQQDMSPQDTQQQDMQQQEAQQQDTGQQDTQQGPPAKRRKLRNSHLQEPDQQQEQELQQQVPPGANVPAELRALLLDHELEKTGRSFTRKSKGSKQQQPHPQQLQQQVEVPQGQEQAASLAQPQQQPGASDTAQQQQDAAAHSDDSMQHKAAADVMGAPAVEAADQQEQGDPALLKKQQEAAARLRRKPRKSGSGAAAVLSGGSGGAAHAAEDRPEPAGQHQQQQHRSPLQPLPAGEQQRPAGSNTSGWQAQGQCSEQRGVHSTGRKCVSEPSGLQPRTRRRSEQQQEQMGGSATVPADKLLELPVEVRRLDPRWNSLANWNRQCKEAKQQQQKEQQPQEQQQCCVDAEPITGQPDDDSCCHQQHQQQQQARQELLQQQQSFKSSKLPRELQQLLVEAPDVDQPPYAERRPTRSAASSRSQSRATTASGEPGPAQQEQQQQRAESVSTCQQRQATDRHRVGSKWQAPPGQSTAAAVATSSAAAARLRQPSKQRASAQVLSSGSRPTQGSDRQSEGFAVPNFDRKFSATASAALKVLNAANAVSRASGKGPEKQQQQQQQQAGPVPTTPALLQQQEQQPGQLPSPQQQEPQQHEQQDEQQAQQAGELLEAQPMQLDDLQPQQAGAQQVSGAATAAPAAPVDGAAAGEVRQAVRPQAQSGPAAEAGVRRCSRQAEQQKPQQQQLHVKEQPVLGATTAAPADAAAAGEGQHAVSLPAQSSGPSAAAGVRRRSQQAQQQPMQQQDQPASTASLQQPQGSAGTSHADVMRPRRLGAPASGAAAAAAGAAGFVFADRKAADAATALLNNGGINPINLPGLEFSHVEWVMQQLGPHTTLSDAQARLDAQQQQGETQGARLDLLYFDQELKDAYYNHTQRCHEHTLFKELDVSMRVSPEALVGRHLRIYWEQDDAWFAGNVVEWDQATARHKVVYDDGQVDWLYMGLERVRLLITAGEELTPPDAATLQQLAQRYLERARAEEQELYNKKKVDPEEHQRPEKLRQKGQALLGAAHIKAHQPPPSTWLVKKPPGAASGGGGSGRGKKRKSIQAAVKGISPAAGAAGPLVAAAGTPEAPSEPAEEAAAAATALCGSTEPPEVAAVMQQQRQHEGALATAPQQQEGPDGGAAKRARLAAPRAEAGTSILKQALHRQATQQQQQQAVRVTFAEDDEARSAVSSPAVSRGNSPAAAATPDADEGTPGAEDAGRDGSGDGSSGSVRFSVRPGEVVWVQVKPNPPWPALVISSEEAADFSVKFNNPRVAQVCIQYFGDYSRARVPVTCLIPTKVALQQQLWLKTVLTNRKEPNWMNQVKTYRIGLREFITYCKDGVLPDSEMVPEHNDERWLMDECEAEREAAATAKDAAAAGKRSHKRKVLGASQPPPPDTSVDELLEWAVAFVKAVSTGRDAAASPGKAGKARLPLQLGPNLLLVSLGRVEYVHPRFHTDKFIYPVGFALKRRARIGGDKEVWHTAEILESPDGSGPLFRVTPDGAQPMTGSNPTAAWQEVYKNAPPIEGMSAKDSAIAVAARAASVCGPRLFGLQHRVVAALIESLPDAALCEGYIAWKGTPPATLPTPPEVLLARRTISAQLSKLPPGVVPQPVQRRGLSLCDSCGEEQEVEGNHLLECDGCGLLVHMGCYGVPSHPNGEAWLCDVCQLLKQPHGSSLSTPPACALCPCVGGMMKPTAEGGWCHLLCAAWVPGCCVADGTKMEPIVGTQRLPKIRLSLRCRLCSQPYGACIQCAHKGCSTAFHASCARAAGYPMLMLEDDSDSEDDISDTESEDESAQQQQQQQQQQGMAGDGGQPGVGQLKQQDSEQPGGPQQQQREEKPVAGRKDGSKGRGKARKNYRYRGGTAAGDNTRLVCYCKKHHAFAATLQGKAIHNKATSAAAAAATKAAAGKANSQQETNPSRQSSPAVTAADVAARAMPGHRRSASSAPTSNLGRQMPERQDVMLFGDLVVITSLPGTSARSRVTDLSSRRHLRAPDAAAVAMRKRLYMQSLPHLVTSQPGTVAELLRLPPPISRISYVMNQQQQQQDENPPAVTGAAPAAPAGAGSSGGAADAAGSSVLQLLQGRLPAAPPAGAPPSAGAGGSSAAGPGPRSAPLSQADRYRRMLSTVNYRLCSGKSAIHGLGVFVKRPHKAGDYLVEYMGHLVRPFMADHMEQTTYNDMVGAGTYIFQLNDKSSVDATRGGNMAHLINHSCAPVAHSRMITVRDPRTNQLVDHVVIVASKDLQPGDEVTYDYRFASEQKLRCNCGAATCRGFVNAPSTGIDTPRRLACAAGMLLPRHEVEILRGTQAVAAAAAAAAFPAKKHLRF